MNENLKVRFVAMFIPLCVVCGGRICFLKKMESGGKEGSATELWSLFE